MMKMKSTLALLAAAALLGGCVATAPQRPLSLEQPIAVKEHASTSNRIGGAGYRITYWNTSPKTIKYLDLTLTAYNAVGDKTDSVLGGTEPRTARDTGPVKPGERKDASWDAAWYGAPVHCVRLDTVKITYMDGTEQQLSEQQVVNALGGLPRCYSNW